MWATLVQARQHWADAANIDDAVLTELLAAANEACTAYAPAHTEPVTAAWRLAEIYQAREIYTAAQRDEQDVIGFGEFAIRARPLTSAVKQLLRPHRGLPAVG